MISLLNCDDLSAQLLQEPLHTKTGLSLEETRDFFAALQAIPREQQARVMPYLFEKIEIFQWLEKIKTEIRIYLKEIFGLLFTYLNTVIWVFFTVGVFRRFLKSDIWSPTLLEGCGFGPEVSSRRRLLRRRTHSG